MEISPAKLKSSNLILFTLFIVSIGSVVGLFFAAILENGSNINFLFCVLAGLTIFLAIEGLALYLRKGIRLGIKENKLFYKDIFTTKQIEIDKLSRIHLGYPVKGRNPVMNLIFDGDYSGKSLYNNSVKFGPEVFDHKDLTRILKLLKDKNSHIELDKYSTEIYEGKPARGGVMDRGIKIVHLVIVSAVIVLFLISLLLIGVSFLQ